MGGSEESGNWLFTVLGQELLVEIVADGVVDEALLGLGRSCHFSGTPPDQLTLRGHSPANTRYAQLPPVLLTHGGMHGK